MSDEQAIKPSVMRYLFESRGLVDIEHASTPLLLCMWIEEQRRVAMRPTYELTQPRERFAFADIEAVPRDCYLQLNRLAVEQGYVIREVCWSGMVRFEGEATGVHCWDIGRGRTVEVEVHRFRRDQP